MPRFHDDGLVGEFDTNDIVHRLRMMAIGKAWTVGEETRSPLVEIVHAAANEIERLREIVAAK